MRWLKYTYRSVVKDYAMDGVEVEREVFTEMAVPDNENGRALAEKEAWRGIVEAYDDNLPDPAPADDDEYADMAAAIREGVNGI